MQPALNGEGREGEKLALASLGMALVLFLFGVNWSLVFHLPQPGPGFQRTVHWIWIGLTALQGVCVFTALLLASDESRSRGLALASLALSCMFMDLEVCLGPLAFVVGVPLTVLVCGAQLFIAIQATARDFRDKESGGGWTLLSWLTLLATPLLGGMGVLGAMPRFY